MLLEYDIGKMIPFLLYTHPKPLLKVLIALNNISSDTVEISS